MLTLTQIHLYPIKGLRGVSVESAEVLARGLRHDRRWMLVDEDGNFLSQRNVPQMVRLTVRLLPDGVVIGSGARQCHLPFAAIEGGEGGATEVRVWKDRFPAARMRAGYDAFFSEVLGVPCRLVAMNEATRRPVNPRYGAPGDETSFADGFPYLIIGQGTLDELNGRLDEPVNMNRFRPNFVFSGGGSGAEDGWNEFSIGGIPFRAVRACSRCVVVTMDQMTGERLGPEPLRTLAQYRAVEGKVMFGQNLLARGTGTVRVGAEIEVISRK